MRQAALLTVAALTLTPSAAIAQDSRQDSGIVVRGQREKPAQRAHRFVRQISTTVGGQFARFSGPVCPAVAGLSAPLAQAIEARLRDVAQTAGAKVAAQGCAPNILVIVAADADLLVKGLRKQLPATFAGLSAAELRRALRDGPVHCWNTVEVRNEDGEGLAAGSDEDGMGGVPVLAVRSASNIELPTQQVTVQSVVVIEDEALVGKSVIQLADYVAMRALAGARPPQAGVAMDTVLTLFDAVAPAEQLTIADAAFLKTLYEGRGTARAVSRKSAISRAIVRDTEK